MRTIKRSGEHEIEVRKSRFLCSLARVTEESEAREFIQLQRKSHHDARHHCSAFVLGDSGEIQKSSDDGEPAGTAGVPMLEVLRRNEITNTVAVVTRYFGGVLLGAGGLVRAYGGAVSEALEHVGTLERRPVRVLLVETDHVLAGKLDNDMRSAGYQVADTSYDAAVRFHVNVPVEQVETFHAWLAENTGGAAHAAEGPLIHAEL
ncbi:YigZ family protein [Saccharopolyspora rhizosphaerae]|uniref:YigZ family protein n=1 Tax=Saccharopolyspora rhizosphaerae TaxID=2492662 RepID=A0A3R8NZC3_9PSEU|nr:YigZ family protein [Saccharopolyspora rhizosphaerae]RRO13136.1 YigZ family protein [Saccharopolyspora rhizosphaerae]